MDFNQLIKEADGSEMQLALDYVQEFLRQFLYSAEIFFSEHTYVLFIILGLIILKTIITIVYGISEWRKGKKITEQYDVCGEEYTYNRKRKISLVRPAVEIFFLILLIRYVTLT